MYLSFYNLAASPFRLAPDHRFFYASSGHKKGLAYLQYGLQQGQGFVVVTGLPGTGKSTLVQTLFADLSGQPIVLANLGNSSLEAEDILLSVAYHFDVYREGLTKAGLILALEDFLKKQLKAGKKVLLIVDEAQNLPKQSLEELRMLSNLCDGNQPLIQIMLLGQQQLQRTLDDPDLEQLTQRIIASCHLKPLTLEETRAYIAHRLYCAGWQDTPSFSAEALAYIYAVSAGVPRLINIFCDRLLLTASLDEKHGIDMSVVNDLLDELRHESTGLKVGQVPSVDMISALEPLPDEAFKSSAPELKPVGEKEPELDVDNTNESQSSSLDAGQAVDIEPQTQPAVTPIDKDNGLESVFASSAVEEPKKETSGSLEEDAIHFRDHSADQQNSILVSKKLLWSLVGAAGLIVAVLLYLLLPIFP